MEKVIYVDVLIFLNTVITFILLLTASQLTGFIIKPVRLITGSLVGGVYSLMLLAPPMKGIAVFAARTAMCVSLICITFDPKQVRAFFKLFAVFLASNYLYAGIIYASFYLLSPDFMQVNNGYAYYDMSILSVIAVSSAAYAVIFLLKKTVFKKNQQDAIHNVEIIYGENRINEKALLDTGSTVRDPFNAKPVMVLNREAAFVLTGEMINEESLYSDKVRIRLLPVKTVAGNKLLPVFTADKVIVNDNGISKETDNPGIAVTEDELGNEKYQALISTDFI